MKLAKKITIGGTLSVLTALLGVFPVYAAELDTSDGPPVEPAIVPVFFQQEEAPVITETKVADLKVKANLLIDQRLASLTQLKAKIQGFKLTDAQKTSLNTMVDGEVTSLTALKTSVAGATDATVLKNLIKSIFVDHRIYGVFIPKVNLMSRVDTLSGHGDKLNAYIAQVQPKIDAAKTAGKDTTAMVAAVTDAQTKIAEIKTSIEALATKVEALKPADYPTASKTALQEIRAGIKDVQAKYKTVRESLKTGLKGLKDQKITKPAKTEKPAKTVKPVKTETEKESNKSVK